MIKAVFLDAIKTIFAPFPSESELYIDVIRRITGKEFSVAEMTPILAKAMSETEQLDAVKNNSIQQWENYPMKIAELIGCDQSDWESVGGQIRYETWGNPENYRLFPDVLPTLRLLKDKELYIACVSNEDGWLGNFFDHFEISKYFQFVLTSDEVGIEKPNPKIFLEALAKTDFKPEEVLFVGDSITSDYIGASNVGMKALLIDRENKCKDEDIVRINDLTKIVEFL